MDETDDRWWTVTAHVRFIDPTVCPLDEDTEVIDVFEMLTAWAEVRGGSCLAHTTMEQPGVWSFQFDPGETAPQHPHPDIETAWREQVTQALEDKYRIAEITMTWHVTD
jgi:hypothetical protein